MGDNFIGKVEGAGRRMRRFSDSREQFSHNFPMHIRQAEVATLEAEGQVGVLDPQQV